MPDSLSRLVNLPGWENHPVPQPLGSPRSQLPYTKSPRLSPRISPRAKMRFARRLSKEDSRSLLHRLDNIDRDSVLSPGSPYSPRSQFSSPSPPPYDEIARREPRLDSNSRLDSSSPRAVLEEVGIVLAVSAVPECSWQMSPRNRPGSPPAPRDWGQLNRVVPEPRAADDLKV